MMKKEEDILPLNLGHILYFSFSHPKRNILSSKFVKRVMLCLKLQILP